MGVFTLRRLFDRNGRLHYRRAVPQDVRDAIGQREWKKSLGLRSGQEAEALSECSKLDQLHDRLIQEARATGKPYEPSPSEKAYEALVLARKLTRD